MKISAQPSLGFQPYHNRNLFADHYLQKVLPTQANWQNAEGVDEAFDAVRKLWAATQQFTNKTNEAQTENDFIKPMLDLLWGAACYQVQPRIPNVDVQRQPDYALFLSGEERTGAQPRINTMDYWRDVPALADAKKWSASLDKERSADENPSAQVCNYLYRSRVRWGILTNGRNWRLYEREKSSAGATYYEVDLADIMLREDRAAFKYFYLFFRRESLRPDASGASFLEQVFRGSVQYAAEVGNSLKESVYDALRHLMNGFFEYSMNELDRNDPETLRLVHQNSLIVLYRLLFLLYAEDRDLLPSEQEPYKEYSLRKLQREINGRLRARSAYLPHMAGIWGQLCSLFALIDEGFPQGGIPAYNGGLFSPSKYSVIAHTPPQGQVAPWRIGDRHIAQVVDLLAYERKAGESAGSSDIDYRTLDVQHLGSIYEGLLELQPRVAPETLVEVVEEKKAVFKPKATAPAPAKNKTPREVAAHEIYLVTNRGERKASGSYYTPKYIVDYIVENTISPLTDAAAEQVKTLRPEVDAKIADLQKRRRQWESAAHNGDAAANTEITKTDAAIEAEKRRLLEPYLVLKVLDPAMGSGHFLVGAADFLSLAMATDPFLPALDASDEDPQLSYKRLVVERCLYGVDLNPLSVELAKLSLWLHTVSRDRALSFLDHHLRCGNSLIGARLEGDLMKEPPQFNAKGKRVGKDTGQLVLGLYETLTQQHLGYLLDVLRQIMETPSGDAKTEHLKDRLYREMDARREQFRAVANCWLAPYFGAPVSNAQYQSAVEALKDGQNAQRVLDSQRWFQDAQEAAQEKRFFHWELEFPEVFLSPQGLKPAAERGFDAVVGNPPYIPNEQMQADERSFYPVYYPVAIGKYESSVVFMANGSRLLTERGRAGFIVPATWQTGENYLPFRKLFSERQLAFTMLINLPFNIFPEAYIDTCITVFSKSISDTFTVFSYPKTAKINQIDFHKEDASYVSTEQIANDSEHRIFTSSGHYDFLSKFINSKSVNVNDLTDACQGPVESFFMYADSAKDSNYLPFFTCQSYRYELELLEPKFIHFGKDNSLARFYTNPRILIRRIVSRSNRLMATYSDKQFVVKKDLNPFVLKKNQAYNLLYLLANLNSRLHSFLYMAGSTVAGKDDFRQTTLSAIQNLPIRRIDFTTPEKQRAQLADKAKGLYQQSLADGDANRVLDFVQEQLDAAPERADVVHDLLAFLAEQMIALNQEKQEETRTFLLWLERRLKSPLDAMSNKTKIKAYHNAAFEDLQNVLKANKRKHNIDVEARDFETRLESEFTASVGKLAPLKAQIAATDDLIDEIVYRLYGLTKAEIGIVKGQAAIEAQDALEEAAPPV